jgi:hypothetical protein
MQILILLNKSKIQFLLNVMWSQTFVGYLDFFAATPILSLIKIF